MSYTKGGALRRCAAALLCALLVTAPLSGARAATIEYTITATQVNIRENANTSSGVLTTASQGDTLQLISTEKNGWLKVSYQGKTGYVSPDYACLTALSGTGAKAIVLPDRLNIRSTPSTSGSILAVPEEDDVLDVLGLTDGWLKVSYRGKTGYVSPQYVSLSAGTETVAPTQAPAATQAPASTVVSSVLKKGSSGADVRALQQKLISLGYLTGTADGIFGENTYRAVVAFQRDKGLTADGEAGPSTLAALALSGTSATPTPTPTPGTSSGVMSTNQYLRIGSNGESVRILQEYLISQGYLSGRADGIFGNATRSAVKAFQRAKGLTADGVAGPATLTALLTGQTPSQTAAPTQAPTPTPAPTQAPTPTPAPSAAVTLLKKGDRGEAVKDLQNKLIALGFLSGQADGIFGNDTLDAVKTFQRNKGIDADGVAGPETLAALSSVTVTPSPEPPETPVVSTLLKKGSKGDEVRYLQTRLIELGYLDGEATGTFGDKTYAAVKAFQRAMGLTADGQAGTLTMAALETATGAPSVSNPTGATLLKYGDTGDAVKQLQTRLKELGYFNGTIGGNFGSETRSAVKAFQTAAGLTADGIAGEQTLAALYASDAPQQQNTTLKAGDNGEAVQKMQERLIELGYLTGTADGIFGSRTQSAVMAFQSAANLVANGIANQATLNALYKSDAPSASAPSQPNETPVPGESSQLADDIIATAKKYLGCKYVYACEDPPYFDCSGLTHYVFRQYGYTLLRTAYQQGYNDKYQKLTLSELKKGDLVFFNTNLTDSDKCDHVGIYMGDGEFIHASSSAGKVIISDLSTGYYNTRFSWGRRILTD